MNHQNNAHYAALMHLRPGDIFFDIGAHAGVISRKLSGSAGHIYAFEPNTDVIKPLATDALPNITIVHKAVSDIDGMNSP